MASTGLTIALIKALAKGGVDPSALEEALAEYLEEHPEALQTDVQINGTSITSQGVANIPVASNSFGVVKLANYTGIKDDGGGILNIRPAGDDACKGGTNVNNPISPSGQHFAAFYGLAKAAGADLASVSGVTVGTYPDAAKVAIQKMLGIYEAPWELIREDTFTNATTSTVTINTDGNGQPFELTDAILMFETPVQTSDSSANGNLVFSDGSANIASVYCGNWTQAANTTAHGCFIVAEKKGNFVFVNGRLASGSTNMANIAQSYNEGFSFSASQGIIEAENFIVRAVKMAQVLGKGHYKLYGKRKWN